MSTAVQPQPIRLNRPLQVFLMTQISSKSYSLNRRQQRTPFVRYFLLTVIAIQSYRVIVKFLPSEEDVHESQTYNEQMKRMVDENGQVIRVSRKDFRKINNDMPREDKDANEPSPQKAEATETDEVLTKRGTGPAKHGYVVDLVEERKHAPFRDASTLPDEDFFNERINTVSEALGSDTEWKSCEIIQSGSIRQNAKCREASVELGVYNGATFSRYLCGTELLPGQSRLLKDCDAGEPIHVFPSKPSVDGNHRKDQPVRFVPYARKGDDISSLTFDTIEDCDIPCEFESSVADISSPGIVDLSVDDWKVRYTKDDPYFNGNAKIERTDFQRGIFYATTSFRSSVPLSFYDFDKFNLRSTKALPWNELKNKATYLVNSDCSAGRRNKWAAAVKVEIALDSYGSCEKTANLQSGETLETMEGRLELLRKNRIALILEKGNEKDHVTEQVWEALLAGVVPAVNGAGNVENRVPKGSIITSAAFNNWDNFAQYVKKVSEDQQLWESFHEWRTNQTELDLFEDTYHFVKTKPQCRLCRWAYAKQYGLGWDHKHQIVKKTHIDQSLCISDSTKLITKPFLESWSTHPASEGEPESCTDSTSTFSFDDGSVRKVVAHDGIVDFELIGVNESLLSLTVALQNSGGAYFPDVHTMAQKAKRTAAISSASFQDPTSRITVLADWETSISSSEQGVILIEIGASDGPRRIRVITEDMDDLHDKLTEFYPSVFGQKMMLDFIDPLEYFYAS